jgi:para-nitrobenzyl esterase
MMKRILSGAALALTLAISLAPAFAQAPPPATEAGISYLALTNVPANGGAKLTVSSPSFTAGGDIPFENTQYRGNTFPGLTWSAGPAGTKGYAIIMQDTDAVVRGSAILHWTMFNIPAGTTKLEAGMTTVPAGSAHGPNIRGTSQPYMGPRTPAGPKHRYHFQVFALDNTIDVTKTYDEILAQMKGHVLASGEVIGLGQVDPNAPPRTPPAGGAPPAAAQPAPSAPAAPRTPRG